MFFVKSRTVYYLLITHILLWVSVSLLISPNLDSHADMIEAYAWGQRFFWGTFKHPPLSGWVTHIWFSLFPTNAFFFYLLSYVDASIGIIGILVLAHLLFTHTTKTLTISSKEYQLFMLLTLVLTLLSGGYSYKAMIYNADTILLPLWPWITCVFFWYHYRCSGTSTKMLAITIFSLLSAIGILAKYFTVILLLSLFIISITDRKMRDEYKTIYPYIAILLIGLLLLPHIIWEYQMHFPSSSYADGNFYKVFNIKTHLKRMLTFFLSGLLLMPMAWFAFAILWRKQRAKNSNNILQIINLKIPTSLWLITLLPFGIIGLLSILPPLFLRLKLHWAIPIWFGLPILMAFLLMKYIHNLDKPFIIGVLKKMWVAILIVALIIPLCYLHIDYRKYTMARPQMAKAIAEQFKINFPNQTLLWSTGSWPETAAIDFYLPHHPVALPNYPNKMPTLINPYPNWIKEYGVILCYPPRFGDVNQDNQTCIDNTKAWLNSNHFAIKQQKIYYHPTEFQYTKFFPRAVTVFWVIPHAS